MTAVTAVAAVMMLHRPQPRDPPPIGRPSTTRLATQQHQRCRQQRRRRGPERPGWESRRGDRSVRSRFKHVRVQNWPDSGYTNHNEG